MYRARANPFANDALGKPAMTVFAVSDGRSGREEKTRLGARFRAVWLNF
jgi:hypothetical protein